MHNCRLSCNKGWTSLQEAKHKKSWIDKWTKWVIKQMFSGHKEKGVIISNRNHETFRKWIFFCSTSNRQSKLCAGCYLVTGILTCRHTFTCSEAHKSWMGIWTRSIFDDLLKLRIYIYCRKKSWNLLLNFFIHFLV